MATTEQKEKQLTPTEVGNLVVLHLLTDRPNKGLAISGFVNSIPKKEDFVIYCLKQIKNVETRFFEEIFEICSSRMDEVKELEIRNLETEIALKQKRLAELKK